MIAGFNLTVRGATPFVMGSAQDATSMQFTYGAAPFVIANQEQGVTHNVILRLANNLILPTKKIWPFVYEIRLMPTIGIAYSAKIIGGVW